MLLSYGGDKFGEQETIKSNKGKSDSKRRDSEQTQSNQFDRRQESYLESEACKTALS